MEILKIKTANFDGGEQAHQITHQDGWDFRGTEKHGGYVRWMNHPVVTLDGKCLWLRGSDLEDDMRISKGPIDWDKITEFFNSDESPLDFRLKDDGKPHFSEITQKDLDASPFEAELEEGNRICINEDYQLYLDERVQEKPFGENSHSRFIQWVADNYSFVKPERKKVVMKLEKVEGFEVRTWKIV